MDFYCILHLSDLHIAPNSEAIRLYSCHHDLAARLYEKLPFSSRFDPSILESILNHANYWVKSLDAILITGDLSSKGRQDDLEKTVDFIQKLEKLGKPVFVLPGNHDRYNWVDLVPFSPGGTLFDSFLKNHWKEGKGGVQIYSLKKSSKNTALYTICADFSLANKKDADSSWGFLGQGKVYEERLAVLEEKTKEITNSSYAVIWAIHFTPEDKHHMPLNENLRLLSSDILIKKAKELGVNYIFTGHTHRKGYFISQFDSDIKIHCSGTSACCDKLDPKTTTSMHIRKILVENKKISQILNLDLHWNGSNFIPVHPHKEAQE